MGPTRAFFYKHARAFALSIVFLLCGSIFVGISSPKVGYSRAKCTLTSATIKYNETDPLYSDVTVVASVYSGKMLGLDVVSNGTYRSSFATEIFTECCMAVNQTFDCSYRYMVSDVSGNSQLVMVPWYIYPVSSFIAGIILLVVGCLLLGALLFMLIVDCRKDWGNRDGDHLLGTESGTTVSEVSVAAPY